MAEKIKGTLNPYFETGTEGVIWSLNEDYKNGYDALVILEAGDELTVFDNYGNIEYRGIVTPDYEMCLTTSRFNPAHVQPSVGGLWVHWLQSGLEPNLWLSYFTRNCRAEILRKIV